MGAALFFTLYVAYTTYLVLDATAHQALTGFTRTMVFFVLPLVVVTLTTTLVYDLHRRVTRRDTAAEPNVRPT